MATIVTDILCDLTQPVKVQYLHGNLFSQDNAANTINVHVHSAGVPESLGGTISANVIRSDGGTVAVAGSVSGDTATVVLPQACYAVPGVIHIIIKSTVSSVVTTIAALVANVYTSSTDTVVDPGTIITDVAALIAEIEEAVDSIPVDYSGLLATIAADYSSSKTYQVGQYAWQGGVLKRCIVPITTAETYTAAHWTNAVIGDDLTNLKSAIKVDETVALEFEQGNISSSTGGNTASSTRIRTPGYYACPFGFAFTVPTGFKAFMYYYAAQAAEAKTGSSGEWATGDVSISTINGIYVRIIIAKSGDSSINPGDITSAINITLTKATDKTLTKDDKAADSKTVGDKIKKITDNADMMAKGIFRNGTTFPIVWTYGEGVSSQDGASYATDKACRTGFTNFDTPFVIGFDDTDYKYLVWVYRNTGSSYRTYSPTAQEFVQGLTLVNPNVGVNSMYKICFQRVDGATLTTDTTDPESDASKIIAALSFYEMTDKTLNKTGYPADSKAVGTEIENITNTILFESVPEYTVKNGNISAENGMNTYVNKTKRIRVDGNSLHQKMPTYAGIKVVVPSGKKLFAYEYSNDTYTEGYEGNSGWLETGTYVFSDYLYYRFVIAFADDSTISPEDVGDVIITNISMTDETLTQRGKPADAFVVGDKLSNIQVFDNLSWGMANVIANSEQVKSVKWTPVGNMPRLGDGNGYFPLTEQTGLPYSSVRDQDKAIGMDVSIHTFMTAVKDPNSVLYTRRSTVSNSACYYGTVCSGMINVAMGYNLDLTNYYLSESDMFETVPMQSITEGDMIWVDGHCALVLKARRDRFGRISEVMVREEWPPLPRDVTYNSWESFLSKRPGYIARRFKDIAAVPYTAIPYVQNFDEEPGEIVYPDVQTEFGDAAVFMSGEDVKINVIDEKDYSYIVVTKDGETVQTVSTIESFTIENVEPGLYTITAVGVENESVSTFFVVDATASFNTGTGVVTFSSTNAEPVLVNVYNLPNDRKITCKPIILTDADREAGQINVSEYMDENYQYAKVTFKTPYGTAVWYSESHSKWNPIT